MRSWNFAILLFVFHTTNSFKKHLKLDKTIVPLMKGCSKVKCPPVHEPVCARLVYNETSVVVHAILLNKCEKKYVQCYPGVQIKLVAMKYCSHDHINTKYDKINEKNKSLDHIRIKRGIRRHEKNYFAECPKVCPIRPVMVCGRCEHGVYTTFLSVCHMRMHYCENKNDSMELVSRSPCMMIAPLLPMNKKHKLPSGLVVEPNDDDTVLRYLWCKERNYEGAYCNKKIEGDQFLSEKNETTDELNTTEDFNTDEPIIAGQKSSHPDFPTTVKNDNSNRQKQIVDPDHLNRTLKADGDSDNPNLSIKVEKYTSNKSTHKNRTFKKKT